MELTREFVRGLPKTDLHIHLDGSLRPETVVDIAKKNNIALPTFDVEELRTYLTVDGEVDNLPKYLEKFDITCSVMQDYESLKRVAFELAEDNAKENVRYVEVRYSPILHQNGGMKLEPIVDAVLDGLHEAEKHFNIRTGVIICGIRSIDPDTSLKLAELTVKYKRRGVVAFDLAGAEYNYPAKDHVRAFYLVRNNNINATLHAGEAFGPESIHQAIHYCGAHRIGHGTRLIEDDDLLEYVLDHRIPLEICLTSNVQTKTVENLEKHPFKTYLERNMRVCLCTDNTLVSGVTITDEYLTAVRTFKLTYPQIAKTILNGFKSVFLPFDEKVEIYQQAKAELLKHVKF